MATFSTAEVLKAMQIIAQSETNSLKLDKTIIAIITEIVGADTGEYKVSYEGNIFSAFSAIPDVHYEVNDKVFVKIPQNDMSNRKIIEGLADSDKTFDDIKNNQTDINTIEPSLDNKVFYNYDTTQEYGIVAMPREDVISAEGEIIDAEKAKYYQKVTFECGSNHFGDTEFQKYAKQYNHLRISASFLTRFVGVMEKGNYGLIVTFRTKDNGTLSYRLDIDGGGLTGRPYQYATWAPQSVIIEIPQNHLLGLESIMLFQENFNYDVAYDYEGNVIYQNRAEGLPIEMNILVKDITINFVDIIDLTKQAYYLDIVTPSGISFSGSTTSLPLIGQLKSYGTNILNSSYSCYWFKENPEKWSENVDNIAGPGWERVQGDFNKYEASIDNTRYHTTYRFVVVWNAGKSRLYKDITLYREPALFDISIVQTTNGNQISLKIQDNLEHKTLLGDWYVELSDGTYSNVSNGKQVNSILVDPRYLTYPIVYFSTIVYDTNNSIISVERFTLKKSDNVQDLTVVYEGSDLYQYDANGDIAFEDTETDRTLSAKVEWREGFGSAYSLTWYVNGEVIVPGTVVDRVSIPNSMMDNLWVDFFNVLHYTIKQKFKFEYSNNTVSLKITTVGGTEYFFDKQILFLKDGDQGTNGSTFVCVIRPFDETTRLFKTQLAAAAYNSGSWVSPLPLRCYVFRDSILLNQLTDDYEIDYRWEDASTKKNLDIINHGYGNDYKYVKGKGLLDESGNYVVKCTVNVRVKRDGVIPQEDIFNRTTLYCTYPINVLVGDWDSSSLQLLEHNFPDYIKYTAQGINPLYQNKELYAKYNGTELKLSATRPADCFDIEQKVDAETGENRYLLKPVKQFLYESGIGAIKALRTGTNNYFLHPIVSYLNHFGNEPINGWDGTSLVLREKSDGTTACVLAPTVGAGKKNSDNTFTGVVMGVDTDLGTGLYGYDKGYATFGLDTNGKGFIGKSGNGQILFDGNGGIIKSANYSSSDGMQIDLESGSIDAFHLKLTSGALKINSDQHSFEFNLQKTNSSGTATNGTFILKGYETNSDGSAPSNAAQTNLFYISGNNYYLKSANYVPFEPKYTTIDGYRVQVGYTGSGTYFNLRSGQLYTNSAYLSGTIYSSNGNIGGWNISEQALTAPGGNFRLGSDGSIRLGNYFNISSSGLTINFQDSGEDAIGNLHNYLTTFKADAEGIQMSVTDNMEVKLKNPVSGKTDTVTVGSWITQKIDAINFKVAWVDDNGVTQTNEINLTTGSIDLKGLVRFKSDGTSVTEIDGGKIKTDSITSNSLGVMQYINFPGSNCNVKAYPDRPGNLVIGAENGVHFWADVYMRSTNNLNIYAKRTYVMDGGGVTLDKYIENNCIPKFGA